MKKILFRTSLFLVPTLLGVVLALGLTFAGDKSRGPLEDLANTLNVRLASFEKDLANPREQRAAALHWFDRYRRNTVLLNAPDTFYLGAYDDHTAESYESIVSLEDSLQTRLPIISLYTAWGSKSNQVFPALRAQAIADLGSIPMITWEPWLDDFDAAFFPAGTPSEDKNKGGLHAIAAGRFDAYIDEWAQDAKKFGAPFFLRLGHEMNDPYRYPWGPQNNQPGDFIAAWKHVVERFRLAGAKNAVWVWSPHPAYPSTEFYPGNDYVNWIGTTTINYGSVATWSQWWSFDDILGKFYGEMAAYKKPLILTEFGSLSVGGDRAQWFGQAFQSLRTKYPAVKALVFFHVASDNTTTYKSLDWSFKNDPKTVRAIRQALRGTP